MRSLFRKIGAVLCVFGLLLTLCISPGSSITAADSTELTIICKQKDNPIEGLDWRLYRVGSYDGNKITLEGAYAGYRVTFGDYSAKALADAASTLESNIIAFGHTPDYTGRTNEKGEALFTNLPDGIYVAASKRIKRPETHQTIVPYATIFNVDGKSNPEMKVYPKFNFKITLDAIQERYEVRKVWENPKNLPMKKTEITVGIYEDGELTEKVKLNEENDWTYHWMVYVDADWRVVELDIPEDCSVVYRSDGRYYVCVNTFEPDEAIVVGTTTTKAVVTGGASYTTSATNDVQNETGTTTRKTGPLDIDTDTRVSTTETDNTTGTVKTTVVTNTTVKTTKSPSGTTTASKDKLPQTGQLWWPVPVMIITGLVFIAIGMRITSGSKRKKNNE